MKLSLTAAMLASIPVGIASAADRVVSVAPVVDEAGPIGKKWVKLGGAPVVGKPTSTIVSTPDGAAQYQTFARGVIIFSVDWGAMLVSHPMFQRWIALNNEVDGSGANLLAVVGFPKQDYRGASGLEIGEFERGTIVVDAPSGAARVVHSSINAQYISGGEAGVPLGEEMLAPSGGRYQPFQNGDIYWHSDAEAWLVRGAIRQHWLDLGGSEGPLGYPLSNETPVLREGVEVGRSTRFEHGTIYYSPGTGAWEVKSPIRESYEQNYGGPTGWLGFPTSGQGSTPTSGGTFNDFEHGVIVSHDRGPLNGTFAFKALELFVQRIEGSQSEGLCGSEDVYAFLRVRASGNSVLDVRRPTEGNVGSGADFNEIFPLVTRVQSNLVLDCEFEGRDEDGLGCGGDDHLGTVTRRYSIDNLWGLKDLGPKTATDDGSFTITSSMRSPLPFDPGRFRQQMFWSFNNPSTSTLSYNQFAATFRDVGQDESAFFHPFNRLYYELVYKGAARGGNCFGMSLESVFAQVNRSLYSQPIYRFWPDTQDGRDLNESTDPGAAGTLYELGVKQGYQLGAASINFFLSKFLQGEIRDPRRCFLESREAHRRGDYPVLALSEGLLSFQGHAVRPYRWDDSDPRRWLIYVANPNNPPGAPPKLQWADDSPPNLIEIDPVANTFKYHHDSNSVWTGGDGSGGRMFSIPFHVLADTPRTPFWEVLALLRAATFFILGDAGQTRQIHDDVGHTLFRGEGRGPEARWDDLQDDTLRTPGLAPVLLVDGGTGPAPELYYGRAVGVTYRHEVVPKPNVVPGTPIEWVYQSAALSSLVVTPASPGIPDIFTTGAVNAPGKSIGVGLPAEAPSKTITWTFAGPVKERWLELTNLQLVGGQMITARLSNGGFEATLENSGPTTTADLRVQAGPDATPVVVGTITLEGNTTSRFAFDAPHTTLTYGGGSPGRNGWLLSPITITLAARDYSSKGIAGIAYSTDGSTWTTYTGPFELATEGITHLRYRATDNAGNQEGAQTQTFQIDTQPPLSTLTVGLPQYAAGPPIVIPSITPLTLSAADSASGVQSVSYRFYLQSAQPPAFQTLPSASAEFKLLGEDGLYVVEYYATDVAGNVEAVRRQEIRLGNGRSVEGLQALYTFEEGQGQLAHDMAGTSAPLDLSISDMTAVQWVPGGLRIDAPTRIASAGPASSLVAALRLTSEVTIEAWIQPARYPKHGIRRIVSLSGDATRRNVALIQSWETDQEFPSYQGRLRTTETSVQGKGPATPPWKVIDALTHVVYTRDASGMARLYINGAMKDDTSTPGDFSNWDDHYPLVLGNEPTADRPWRGVYQLVSVYNRALSPAEVQGNFMASPSGDGPTPHLGILAQYTFAEGTGQIVHDTSGVGTPLDLRIADSEGVTWSQHGLTVVAPTRITSAEPATKLNDAMKRSGELTIEAWVQTSTTTTDRPACIVGIARDAYNRNAAIDQGRWRNSQQDQYTAQVRTSGTLRDEQPLYTTRRTVQPVLTHLVLTRDEAGETRLYLNGVLQGERSIGGSLAIWTKSAVLVLANAPTGELPWLGTYREVTISNRAWSPAEVRARSTQR